MTYTYDRLGRVATVTQGTLTTTLTYNDLGQGLTESYSGGDLAGLGLTNAYNALFLRTNLAAGPALNRAFSYDAASRLDTISDGTNSASYSYHTLSPLVDTITFRQNGATRLTTSRSYDYLNRLTQVASTPSAAAAVSFDYQHNDANQRTRVTLADGSYWLYEFDPLGQVASGKKYWPDGSLVAGQQFGYRHDDIGNRTATEAGGDAWGGNLRQASYGANSLHPVRYDNQAAQGVATLPGSVAAPSHQRCQLSHGVNQYTNRSAPGAVDVVGTPTNTRHASCPEALRFCGAPLPRAGARDLLRRAVADRAVQSAARQSAKRMNSR